MKKINWSLTHIRHKNYVKYINGKHKILNILEENIRKCHYDPVIRKGFINKTQTHKGKDYWTQLHYRNSVYQKIPQGKGKSRSQNKRKYLQHK